MTFDDLLVLRSYHAVKPFTLSEPLGCALIRCPALQACVETKGGEAGCVCIVGYEKVGDQCVDIDECKNTDICGGQSQCINKDGYYTCSPVPKG